MADTVNTRQADARVTIGIPTCNRVARLEQAIGSVVAQTVQDWELVVFDDGSTDGTERLMASYADPRITYVRNAHPVGPAANMSQILRAGRAPFVGILLDDDVLLPEHLQRTCTLLEAYPRASVAHSAIELWSGTGDRRTIAIDGAPRPFEESAAKFTRRATIEPPRVWLATALMRRSAVSQLTFRGEDEPVADAMFWLRAAGTGTVVYEPVPTARHRVSAELAPGRELLLAGSLRADGGYQPTFTTISAYRRSFAAFLRERRPVRRERALLRAAELRAVHAMVQAVVLRRLSEEPTRADRVAVLREAVATDPTILADPLAWARLSGPALRALRRAERRLDDRWLDRVAQRQTEAIAAQRAEAASAGVFAAPDVLAEPRSA